MFSTSLPLLHINAFVHAWIYGGNHGETKIMVDSCKSYEKLLLSVVILAFFHRDSVVVSSLQMVFILFLGSAIGNLLLKFIALRTF